MTRTSLDNVPQEVAINIAAQINAWQESDFSEKSDFSSIDKYSALSNLSKLSKESNQVWLPSLLEEVQVNPSTLHSLVRLLNRDPQAGKSILRLIFLESSPSRFEDLKATLKKAPPPTNVSLTDPGFVSFDQGGLGRLMADGNDGSQPEPVIQHLAQVNAKGSQALAFLHPFFNKDSKIIDDDSLKPEFPKIHKEQCANALAFIIDSSPNLQSLEVRGKPLFPFSRAGKPLQGLSSLREISLLRGLEKGRIISGRNLIWLLALPNVVKADLCVSIGKKDAKYLTDHEEVLTRGICKVKKLEVRFIIENSMWKSPLQYSRLLFDSIVGLEHLKITAEMKLELEQLLEAIKKHSATSLRSLTLKPGSAHQGKKWFSFDSFKQLEIIESDGNLLDLLVSAVNKLSKEDGSLPQVLPPALKAYRVIPNYTSGLMNLVSKWDLPADYQLVKLIRTSSLPKSFKSVSSFERNESEGIVTSELIPDSEARDKLRKTCEEFGMKFEVLEAQGPTLF